MLSDARTVDLDTRLDYGAKAPQIPIPTSNLKKRTCRKMNLPSSIAHIYMKAKAFEFERLTVSRRS